MKLRKLVETITARLQEPDPLIQVIIGPRQVGKTTALKAALKGRGLYETADFPTPLPASVIDEWWDKAEAHPDRLLAIDEIQKISGWTEVLKKRWEASSRPLKVLVTGSSALLVEKGLRETLAGRFELIRAEHWNYREAREVFGLSVEQFIEYGCYPGAVRFLGDLDRWGSYLRDSIVEPALGRDLMQLKPVDQPALLRQLFGVACSLPAQIVSLQKLQGQLQGRGTLPTLQHYLDLLSQASLVSGVQKYSGSSYRVRKSSPKLIVHDNGLIRALQRPLQKPLSAETFGRYFENAVGARFLEAGWETYYWKERDAEVDFVVRGPEGQDWAVEVKSSSVSEEDLRGIRRFCNLHPEFEPCLISLAGQEFEGLRTLAPEEVLNLCRKY